MIKGFTRIADARSKRDQVTTDGMLRVLMSGGYVAIGSLIVDSAGKHDRTVYGAEGTTGLMSEVECSELSAQEVAARPDLRALFRITDEV